MDSIRAAGLGHAQNFFNAQIGCNRSQAFADLIGFIGFETMQAELILFGIDSHRALAQFICRAHDANCNFTAVGNQDFFEVGHECSSYYAVAAFKARIPMVTNCFLSFYCQNSRFPPGFAQ